MTHLYQKMTHLYQKMTHLLIQPVPWKIRLEMLIGMQNEILIGIKKVPCYVSFQIFKRKET